MGLRIAFGIVEVLYMDLVDVRVWIYDYDAFRKLSSMKPWKRETTKALGNGEPADPRSSEALDGFEENMDHTFRTI